MRYKHSAMTDSRAQTRAMTTATLALLRRDPWLSGGMLLTLVAVVLPLWTADLLPFMDLPQHLAAARTLHSFDDPAFGLDRFHVIDLSRTQYLSYYFAVDWLTWLMPLETANRVVLSLYALGTPLSLAAFLRAFDRDPALSLLAAPLAWNTFLFMGFANYLVAIPLMFWALALLGRLMAHFCWRRFSALTALTLLIFYSHAQIFGLYVGLAGLVGLFGGGGWQPRHWWRQSLHLVPAILLLLVWMSRSLILAGAETWKQGHGGRNVTDTQVRFEPILERFVTLPRQLLDAYRDDSDEMILLALLAIACLAALFSQRNPASSPSTDPAPAPSTDPAARPSVWRLLNQRLPALMFAAVFAVYILSPISFKWIWPISHRMVPVVALVGLGALAGRSVRWRAAVVVIPATLLAMWSASIHVDKIQAFNREAGPIRAVVQQAEPGHKLVALIFDKGSAITHHAPYLHYGQYYVIDRGGMATFSFANFPQSPVLYPSVGGPPALPARWEWTPDRFDWAGWGSWYDYVLIRSARDRSGAVFGRKRGEVELVTHQGSWWLYRRLAGA